MNPALELEKHIREVKSDFFVVQIGANDGKMADPLHSSVRRYGWQGIFVEPVTYLYNKLIENYKGCEGLVFENIAIAKHDGEVEFYQFPQELEKEDEFPFWAPGMGSLLEPFVSPGHTTLKSRNFKMIKKKTPCLAYNSLLVKHDVEKVDLLQIDIEGYDGELLTGMDFSGVKPKFIRYEDRHIQRVYDQGLTSVSSADVVEHLSSAGYSVSQVTNGFDRVCFLS